MVAACADPSTITRPARPVVTSAEAMRHCTRRTEQPPRMLTPAEIDAGWRMDRRRLEDCADRHDALIAEVRRRQGGE